MYLFMRALTRVYTPIQNVCRACLLLLEGRVLFEVSLTKNERTIEIPLLPIALSIPRVVLDTKFQVPSSCKVSYAYTIRFGLPSYVYTTDLDEDFQRQRFHKLAPLMLHVDKTSIAALFRNAFTTRNLTAHELMVASGVFGTHVTLINDDFEEFTFKGNEVVFSVDSP